MDLSLYRATELEQWITDLYPDNGIYTPADLDIDQIAAAGAGLFLSLII